MYCRTVFDVKPASLAAGWPEPLRPLNVSKEECPTRNGERGGLGGQSFPRGLPRRRRCRSPVPAVPTASYARTATGDQADAGVAFLPFRPGAAGGLYETLFVRAVTPLAKLFGWFEPIAESFRRLAGRSKRRRTTSTWARTASLSHR